MSTLHWRGKLYGLCRPEWFIFTLPLTATYVSTLSYHCLVSLIWHKSLDLELSYRLPNLQIKMSLIIYCAKAWNLILRFLFLIFLFFKFVTAKELVSRFKLVRSWLLIFFFCGNLLLRIAGEIANNLLPHGRHPIIDECKDFNHNVWRKMSRQL